MAGRCPGSAPWQKRGGLAEPRASCGLKRRTQALDLAPEPIPFPLQLVGLALQPIAFLAQALVLAPLAFHLALEPFTLRVRRAFDHALVMPESPTVY